MTYIKKLFSSVSKCVIDNYIIMNAEDQALTALFFKLRQFHVQEEYSNPFCFVQGQSSHPTSIMFLHLVDKATHVPFHKALEWRKTSNSKAALNTSKTLSQAKSTTNNTQLL